MQGPIVPGGRPRANVLQALRSERLVINAEEQLAAADKAEFEVSMAGLLRVALWAGDAYTAFLDRLEASPLVASFEWSARPGGGLSETALRAFFHTVVCMEVRRFRRSMRMVAA